MCGKFGRTVYFQGTLTETNYGRDHHPRCFTMRMAGGACTPGTGLGQTDDCFYNIVEAPVHIHDVQAPILHCLTARRELHRGGRWGKRLSRGYSTLSFQPSITALSRLRNESATAPSSSRWSKVSVT